MNVRVSKGFTIVEVMLFLAVTGALILSMGGVISSTIGAQRYRDAVDTFKSTIQNQYSQLTSVSNDRGNNWSCDAAAVTAEGATGSIPRGQSNCVLLGRYMAVIDDQIITYPVVGYPRTGASSSSGTDVSRLKSGYTMNISTLGSDKAFMEWGTRIAWPSKGSGSRPDTTPRSIALLFVRSPESGQIYTFTNDTASESPSAASLQDMIVAGIATPGQGQSRRTICIEPNGLLIPANQSVVVNANAGSASAVEVRSNDMMARLGEDTEC